MTTKSPQEVEKYLIASGDSMEFVLQTVFYHVPGNDEQDEFWWRSCALHDGMVHGEQGYLMVWWREGKLTTFHTYRHPEDWAV